MSKIEFGSGWELQIGKNEMAKLPSSTGESVPVFKHATGTWVEWKGRGLVTEGKVSLKPGGVILHNPGATAKMPGLKVTHTP